MYKPSSCHTAYNLEGTKEKLGFDTDLFESLLQLYPQDCKLCLTHMASTLNIKSVIVCYCFSNVSM